MTVINAGAALAAFTTANTPDGLRVIIPCRRSAGTRVFLIAWLVVWIPGGLYGLSSASHGMTPSSTLGFVVWFIAWVVGIVFGLGAVLWQLGGREVLTIGPDDLSYRAEACGLGRTCVYRLAEIRRLRNTLADSDLASTRRHARSLPPWATSHGAVGFDYRGRTVRFAPALDDTQAGLLVHTLRRQLPGEPGVPEALR